MGSRIEAEIIEEHAEELGFLWGYRDGAVGHPAFDLPRIQGIDERIDAHLDGLALDPEIGWDAARDALRGDRVDAGVVFTAAALALRRGHLHGFAQVLDAGAGDAALARGIVSAFGLLPFELSARVLPGLFSATAEPALWTLGIAACAAHREDPGATLGYAAISSDPRLKARALRAAGELGRADIMPELRAELRAEDPACRFWAAWSAALLGEEEATQVLWAIAAAGGPFAERAAGLALRKLEPRKAATWLYTLAGSGGSARTVLTGAAALGDPALVPWLIEHMQAPETARAAGAALTMVTGIDLAAERLAVPPPAGGDAGPTDDPDDDGVAMDPDDGLPWPDAAAVQAFWTARGGAFPRGVRHLLGKPIEPAWLLEVLRRGAQPARAAAALELCLARPKRPLLEVRAPVLRQERAILEQAS